MAASENSRTNEYTSKRFYVGNLFHDVSESDLSKLFSKHGQVQNVEIKNKRDIDGNNIATFAFVTLEMKNQSENAASLCIREYNNLKWKKNLIKVQIAQESFLQRLQKERQESSSRIQTTTNTYDPLELVKQKQMATSDKSKAETNFIKDASFVDTKNDKGSSFSYHSNSVSSEIKIGAVDFLTAQDEQVQPNRKKVSLNAKKVYHSSSEEELDLSSRHEKVQQNRKKVSLNSKKVYHSSSEEELDLSSKHEQPLELKPVRKDNVKADKPIKSKETTSYKKATDTSEIKSPVSKNTQPKRQYYSSSSDDEENSTPDYRNKRKRVSPYSNARTERKADSFLNKLESFNSGFWQDDPIQSTNDGLAMPTPLGSNNTLSKSDVPELESKVDNDIKSSKIRMNKEHDNFDARNDSMSSFTKNMLRFDPSDKEHMEFESKKQEESPDKYIDMSQKVTDEVSTNESNNKNNFWMSTSFASQLSSKLKNDKSVNDTSKKAPSFTFGFASSKQDHDDTVYDQTSSDRKVMEKASSSSVSLPSYQNESSDEELPPSDGAAQPSYQDKLVLGLRKNNELDSEGKFGLKLKEKAIFASAITSNDGKLISEANTDPFFFTINDPRMKEGLAFLKSTEPMDDLRTKFEQKRPILAEIFRKKMRNKIKKQEKISFGSSGRKLNKRKKIGKKFGRHIRKTDR